MCIKYTIIPESVALDTSEHILRSYNCTNNVKLHCLIVTKRSWRLNEASELGVTVYVRTVAFATYCGTLWHKQRSSVSYEIRVRDSAIVSRNAITIIRQLGVVKGDAKDLAKVPLLQRCLWNCFVLTHFVVSIFQTIV